MKKYTIIFLLAVLTSCTSVSNTNKKPFVWEGSNLYFLLTDRFYNGDSSNDVNFKRNEKTAVLRGFEGGDLRGVIKKLDEGYFTNLGINAIWLTPLVEQIHGAVDEGTGNTYGFHGYWTKDWTALDPNFGTKKDLKELVEKAHKKGIRIVLDAVINHTGPVTKVDPVFPENWVRTSPQCTYNNYQNTIQCTLVKNLPDIRTDSETPVALPQQLVEKWKKEGRYEKEVASLNAFFAKTGYPRAPKYYIMKWLADYILEFGIDGYRVDTVKHTEEDVWKEFEKVCQSTFNEYKKNNPDKVLDNNPFFTVGELYGYGISQELYYNFGDKKVNYYENGFQSLINFDFKSDAKSSYEEIFYDYNQTLQSTLKGKTVMNYLTSHDDGWPFDKERTKTYESATKLLLAPGISQIYYGDETARKLIIKGAEGDANLRSNMNWDDVKNNPETQKLLAHYQKLGKFRANHPAVGAGAHQRLSKNPYVFSRIYKDDVVVVGLDLPTGKKTITVEFKYSKGDQSFTEKRFEDGTKVRDAYSGKTTVIKNGNAEIDTPYDIVLLEKI